MRPEGTIGEIMSQVCEAFHRTDQILGGRLIGGGGDNDPFTPALVTPSRMHWGSAGGATSTVGGGFTPKTFVGSEKFLMRVQLHAVFYMQP